MSLRLLPLAIALIAAPPLLTAQATGDTASRGAPPPARAGAAQRQADSLRAPVSPGRAFLTSLLLPGLGQSRLGRPLPGAIYAGVEAMSFVMLIKARNDLRIARAGASRGVVNQFRVDPATGAPIRDESGAFVPLDSLPSRFDADRVDARRTQVEDWIAVLVFNHLFAGADAFVASLLWDLPARVGLSHGPGGLGLGLSVRW